MPRIYGLIPTTEDLPFAQAHYYVGGPGNVANMSSAVCTFGTFQMPWDGNLFGTFTMIYAWNGPHQHVRCALSSSTPGPNAYNGFDLMSINSTGTMRGQAPMHGIWQNLVKNQVITITALCQVGNGGPTVVFESGAGNVRAVRVGL